MVVDGQTITVNWGTDGKSAEITAPPGKHRIEVKKEGFVVSGKEVTIEEGGREILTVVLESAVTKQESQTGGTPSGKNVVKSSAEVKEQLDTWMTWWSRTAPAISSPRGDNRPSDFELGQWHDVLKLADVDHHAINGKWFRRPDGVYAEPSAHSRLIVPVQISGDYELSFSFTRLSGQESINFLLPVDSKREVSVVISGWDGRVSGFELIDDQSPPEQPVSPAVVRPGHLQNNHRYSGTIRVTNKDTQVAISVELDGKPYFGWSGNKTRLRTDWDNPLPRHDLLGIGAFNVDAVFHDLRLKPISGGAWIWDAKAPVAANTPPQEIREDCVQWNGKWFWMSVEKTDFAQAVALAEKYRGRLLRVTSRIEHDFVVRQWPHRAIWLNAWRNGQVRDPRTGWFDDRCEPLQFFGPWGNGQPDGTSDQCRLGINDDQSWHDFLAGDAHYTCIEWSELAPGTGANSQTTLPPKNPPQEFRLSANGLGGKTQIEPIIWKEGWAEKGEFAHVRGRGELLYPQLKGCSYAMDFDVTFNKGRRATLEVFLGEIDDANLLLSFDIGYDMALPDGIKYRIWAQWNDVRWCTGDVDSRIGERIRITLLVNEGLYAIVRGNRCIHSGYSPPDDLVVRMVSNSPDLDAVIHSCQLRPLTPEDFTAAGWQMPPKDLKFEVSAAKARLGARSRGFSSKPKIEKPFLAQTTATPLVWIKPGTFTMGEPEHDDCKAHKVRLSRGFWMAQYEILQREWNLLMPANPSRVNGSPYLPVECVTYEEALKFCAELTRRERAAGSVPDGYEYRLPTEAEWEYVCRAGREGTYAVPEDEVWSAKTFGWHPHEAGEIESNPWRVYDMLGNIVEWCLDAWHDYPKDEATVLIDPFDPPTGAHQRRIMRGGGWWDPGRKPWNRESHYSVRGGHRGFRMVLGPILTDKLPESVKSVIASSEATAPATPKGTYDADLTAVLSSVLEKHNKLPGIIAAIVDGEQLTAIGAVGVRKSGSPERMTADDVIHLGGDTGAMTATLIGKLVENKRLQFDTPMSEIFRDLAPRMNGEMTKVTVRQLLDHTAGLPANVDWWKFDASRKQLREQRRMVVEEVLTKAPVNPPGTKYLYSNVGFVVLGAILEQKSDMLWEELIEQELFQPLGMKTAGFGPPGTPGSVDEPWGHAFNNGVVSPRQSDNAPVMGPAARVHCSLRDWAKFVSLYLQLPEEKHPILSPKMIEELISPGPVGEFAGGWKVTKRDWADGKTLNHSGSNTMWFCVAWLAPKQHFAVLVATNIAGDDAEKACDEATREMIKLHAKLGQIIDTPTSDLVGGRKVAAGDKMDWSPDGTSLVVTKKHTGTIEDAGLEIHDLATGAVRDLVKSGKDPAWSPLSDGPIAFIRGSDASKEEIWLVRPDGTGERKVASEEYPHWSGDGETLYYHDRGKRSVMAISPDDPNAVPKLFCKDVLSHYPVVSPNGSMVAYVSAARGLAVAKCPGGEVVKSWLLAGVGGGGVVAWHPDGKRVAYGGYSNAATGLWLADLETGKSRKIIGGSAWRPAWSHDGKHFLYALDYDIYIIDDDKLPGHPPVTDGAAPLQFNR